jgi:hypothetical protein
MIIKYFDNQWDSYEFRWKLWKHCQQLATMSNKNLEVEIEVKWVLHICFCIKSHKFMEKCKFIEKTEFKLKLRTE